MFWASLVDSQETVFSQKRALMAHFWIYFSDSFFVPAVFKLPIYPFFLEKGGNMVSDGF
jgi:hypothetical protein